MANYHSSKDKNLKENQSEAGKDINLFFDYVYAL